MTLHPTHLTAVASPGSPLTSWQSPAVCPVQRIQGDGGNGAWLPDLPQSGFRAPPGWVLKPQDRNGGCRSVPTDMLLLEWAGLGNDCCGQCSGAIRAPLSKTLPSHHLSRCLYRAQRQRTQGSSPGLAEPDKPRGERWHTLATPRSPVPSSAKLFLEIGSREGP